MIRRSPPRITLIGSGVLVAVGLIAKRRGLMFKSGWVLAAVAASGLITLLLKMLFGRWRPTGMLNPHKYGEVKYGMDWFETARNQTSFPSGHATTVFAAIGVLWLLWPRAWWVWLPLGVAMAMTRVLVNAHYVSDVMVGSWIGFTTALILRDWFAGPAVADTPAADTDQC